VLHLSPYFADKFEEKRENYLKRKPGVLEAEITSVATLAMHFENLERHFVPLPPKRVNKTFKLKI
jgi:hypothetical protein